MTLKKNVRMLVIWIALLSVVLTLSPTQLPVTSAAATQLSRSTVFTHQQDWGKPSLWRFHMNHARDGPPNHDVLFDNYRRRFPHREPDEELLHLESQLRSQQIFYRPDIKRWYRIASRATGYNRDLAIRYLHYAIEAERIERRRHPDQAAFRPPGPEVLLSQGDLTLLIQAADGIRWKVPRDALSRPGCVLAGQPGGGKSSLIVHICKSLGSMGVTFNLIDPKAGMPGYSRYLSAPVVDISEISLDLDPPGNMTYGEWITEYLCYLASDLGVVQGSDLLQSAGQIAVVLRERYIKQTGRSERSLCLRDIFTCLSSVRDTERGRREGYLQGLKTALSRVLSTSGNLFSCSRGIRISELLSQNSIITASSLVDPVSCKVFANYLLAWIQADSRGKPESPLRHLLVLDDAHRYLCPAVGQADPASVPTSMTMLGALLRQSGVGILAASQVPSQVDPGFLALLGNLTIVVGGIHDVDGQKVVGNLMSLSPEQRQALVSLRPREAVGFYSGGAYRHPVHGWTLPVPRPEAVQDIDNAQRPAYLDRIEPWHNLWDMPAETAPVTLTEAVKPQASQKADLPQQIPPTTAKLTQEKVAFGMDLIANPFDENSVRRHRLDFSVRKFEYLRRWFEGKELIWTFAMGHYRFLVNKEGLYRLLNVDVEKELDAHSFALNLACHHLRRDPQIVEIQKQVKVKDNAIVDILLHLKNGQREALEITLSVGNVVSNCSRLADCGFSSICFLCRDHTIRQGAWNMLKAAGLPDGLFAKVRCMLFSQLLRKYKTT